MSADADLAGDDVAQRGDVGVERFELGLDPPGTLEHDAPLVGRLRRRPVDQRQPELALEPRDVGGDVRLHGVERPGRSGEGAVFGDGDERSELLPIHR